ncbi:phage terminase large subunit-like protein [Aquamicrobium lusatiense]|uniref:Phage terminase large subunit-like protein n=1 Tax=Aquamicrobium lusatiense TaxID=89772 RepID=A0A7W9S552_9HYPH|nr:terminase TerL endonuclease subunit [Aquamicrobium lusatiense]MBB6013499.1 phage terminase large subunit-like protein [Aquamicrobium lusatiense]
MAKAKTLPTNSSELDPLYPCGTVDDYAEKVISGEIIAGPHVRNACRRHRDDRLNGPDRGIHWDPEAADRVFRFFRTVLRLNGGQFEGRPFNLHDSQKFIVGSLFGWKMLESDGAMVRRFRRAYIEMGKGNGKSPLAGGIGHYAMVADGEAAAEIYAAAANKDQAFVLFRDAVAMYEQSPKLKAELTPSGGNPVWNLAYLKRRSFFRPISREGAHSGPRPYVALCDEIHEHPDGRVIEMLERGFKFRRQPLLFMITNSGSDRNSICWEEHVWACKVAAGTDTPDEDFTYVGEIVGIEGSSDRTFSYVCALDKDDDPFTDPTCWQKANPLFGVTLKHDYLAGVVAQARDIPSKRNGILRLHFCVWTEADTAWIPRPLIEKVMGDFDPYEDGAGAISAAGLDLSRAKDLTAASFVRETGVKRVVKADGTEADLPTYDLWVEAWTPRDTMDERSKTDSVPYRTWYEQGYIHAPEGGRIRYDHVAALIARLHTEFGIGVLAYDNYAYDKFADELDAYGCDVRTVAHPQGGKKRARPDADAVEAAKAAGDEPPQGLWMPGSVAALEELILEERVRIRKSPVMMAALMGVHIETDPLMGNQWFNKNKTSNRIDPAVAAAMAVGAAVEGRVERREPKYQMIIF